MQQIRALQCDNFFENPNLIRECALAQTYRTPDEDESWLGLRTEDLDVEIGGINIETYIKYKVKGWLPDVPDFDLRLVFHLLPESVRGDMGDKFDYLQSHTDSEVIHFAGVVYLSPNPPPHSGTSFFEDVSKKIGEVENVYNRFVFYPADIIHSPTNPFGETNEDSRLALTFFASIKDKNIIGNNTNT
jgi:hypothetical protein